MPILATCLTVKQETGDRRRVVAFVINVYRLKLFVDSWWLSGQVCWRHTEGLVFCIRQAIQKLLVNHHHHHHHHDAKTAEVRCDDSPWWPWSCAFFHSRLILSGDPLPICMIQELRGRPGTLRQTASGWYPDLTAITCFRIWCAGVVASNLATCPNSMWRLLIIVSVNRLSKSYRCRLTHTHTLGLYWTPKFFSSCSLICESMHI